MAVCHLAADQPLHPPHGGVGSPVLEHELEIVAVLMSALEVLPLGQLGGTAVAVLAHVEPRDASALAELVEPSPGGTGAVHKPVHCHGSFALTASGDEDDAVTAHDRRPRGAGHHKDMVPRCRDPDDARPQSLHME